MSTDSVNQSDVITEAGEDPAGQDESGAAFSEPPAEEQPSGGSADPSPPADEITAESIVEAVLFSADSPLPAPKIAQVMGFGDAKVVKKHIAALNDKYEAAGTAFRIQEIAGGFQMLTQPAFHRWVSKLLSVRRETKLTRASLETLAVVAYKQPVLRADVEAVRGVAVGDVLNRLREMGLVKIVGRAEIIGRPMLYGTTKKFLEVFGLGSLADLPTVESLPPPAEVTVQSVAATFAESVDTDEVTPDSDAVGDSDDDAIPNPE